MHVVPDESFTRDPYCMQVVMPTRKQMEESGHITPKLNDEERNAEFERCLRVGQVYLGEQRSALTHSTGGYKHGVKGKQTVADTAGEKIGNVPANLCRVFKELMSSGLVTEIWW